MSKLDEILEVFWANPIEDTDAKQQIKDLILELIDDEYELAITDLEREAYQTKEEPVVISKTKFRQKVESL